MRFSLLIIFLLVSGLLKGQNDNFIAQNETFSKQSIPLFRIYSAAIGKGAAIYNGPEYNGADPRIAGHPFYQTKNFEYGSASYLNFRYDSLVLAYDIANDQLVLAYPREMGFFAIVPVKSRISQFALNGHTFVNINETQMPNGLTESGYYDVLHDGHFKMISRRKKLALPYREGDYLYRYENNDSYYIWQNNKFRTIRSTSTILQLFREDKREIKQFIRANKINFKSDPDNFVRTLGPFLDEKIDP